MVSRWRVLQRFRRRRGASGMAGGVLKWYESWVVRAAMLMGFILFCAYTSSVIISVQGITSVAKITYDQDIEEALKNYLEMIKRVHELEKRALVDRLKINIPPNVRLNSQNNVKKKDVRSWLNKIDTGSFDTKGAEYSMLSKSDLTELNKAELADIGWIDQETLRVYNIKVHFPKSLMYLDYKTAQNIRQRYQFLGATLEDEIQPTLIRANSLVLAATFAIMIIVFIVLARRLKASVETVIEGFSHWSESDATFRFTNQWKGELRLITAQFNAMADEVEANRKRRLYLEKVASWQTMARKLAHEIKNPLTPIQMMVSQVRRRYTGDDEEFSKLLDNAQEIITEEVTGLRRMVDSFSKFARLPNPKFQLENLGGILERVVELQKAAFPKHEITYQSEVKNLQIPMDADLFRQVAINLIKNAAEAGGDETKKIEVRLIEEPHYAKVEIKDNGPGIPPDILKNIFEAYFTTKHTGPTPGMGLGLAICQKIMLDHEGEINVKSKPGETKFILTLPKKHKGQAV